MTILITLPRISTEQFNAILAGLRALQYLMEHDQLPTHIRDILIDNRHGLGLQQIDELCHRLNCA